MIPISDGLKYRSDCLNPRHVFFPLISSLAWRRRRNAAAIHKVEAQHHCLRKRVLARRSWWVMSNALTSVLHLAKYLTAILSAGTHLHYYCKYICRRIRGEAHSVRKMQTCRRAANTASNGLVHKQQGLYSIKLKACRPAGQKQTNRQIHMHILAHTPWLYAVNE